MLKSIDNTIIQYNSGVFTIIIEIVDVIDKLRKFPHTFKDSSIEEKSELLRTMVKRVYVHAECVTLQWRKPFSWIIETVPYKDTVLVLTGTTLRAEQNKLRTVCIDILMRWAA